MHVQHVVLEHGLVAEALAAQIADPEKRISNCFVKIILPKKYFCEGNNWFFFYLDSGPSGSCTTAMWIFSL